MIKKKRIAYIVIRAHLGTSTRRYMYAFVQGKWEIDFELKLVIRGGKDDTALSHFLTEVLLDNEIV